MSATLTYMPTAPAKLYAEGEDPFLFHRLRTWWLLFALFLMAQGNGLFTRQDSSYYSLKMLSQDFESSSNLLLVTLVLWIICAALIVKGLGPMLRLMLKQKAILAFAILAFLSTLWSHDPLLTFRKATLLFFAFAFAWFFATYYSPPDQMRILLAAGIIVALASIAMAVFLPQYGIASQGEWKGVFGQKNRMGLSIFYLFSGLPFCRISNGRRLLTLAFRAILPIGLIFLSQSRTSLILMIALIGVRVWAPLMMRMRRDQLPFMLFSTVFGISLIALAIGLGRDIILPLLGRESTLTGRTEHWALLATFALRHLWLGYGYAAFWTGTGDSLRVITTVGGAMKGSDSGYLDTMLQFGLVGMGLLLIVLLVSVRDLVRLFGRGSVPLIAYWYAGVILTTFVGSFTEILFLVPNGIITFIFVVACAGLRSLSHENAPLS